MSRRRETRAARRLAEQEADLRAAWRAGDPFAAALADFAAQARRRTDNALQAEQDRRAASCDAPSLPLFPED